MEFINLLFHAAKSEQHMLLRLHPPTLPASVILLNFNVSRAVSSGSCSSSCHPPQCSVVGCCLESLHPILPVLTGTWSDLPALPGGGRGLRWSAIAVLHQSTEGSTSLGTNGYHMLCLLGWNQAHYGVNCLEPTVLSCHEKHLNQECKRVSFYYMLDVLFYLDFPPSVYEWNLWVYLLVLPLFLLLSEIPLMLERCWK